MTPSDSFIEWDEQPVERLQERFYHQTLPAVKEPLKFEVPLTPYMKRSGIADCYLFTILADVLAKLYGMHKEELLQRNIRVDQGDTATNRSIETTCAGGDSMNFLHFNNGGTLPLRKGKL